MELLETRYTHMNLLSEIAGAAFAYILALFGVLSFVPLLQISLLTHSALEAEAHFDCVVATNLVLESSVLELGLNVYLFLQEI